MMILSFQTQKDPIHQVNLKDVWGLYEFAKI